MTSLFLSKCQPKIFQITALQGGPNLFLSSQTDKLMAGTKFSDYLGRFKILTCPLLKWLKCFIFLLFYNALDLNNQKILCLPSIYQFERTGTNLDHPTLLAYVLITVTLSNRFLQINPRNLSLSEVSVRFVKKENKSH